MSCEHLFYTWRCQKQARANSQDHSGSESIPGDELVGSKKIEKLPRIPKNGARAQRRSKSMTVLDS